MLKIAPSIMCGNLMDLGQQIRSLEAENVQRFHIDIMDGHFVPGFTFGCDFVQQIRKFTKVPLDVHIMSDKAFEHIDLFLGLDIDYIIIHVENNSNILGCIMKIKSHNAKVGIALTPATPISVLEDILPFVDEVLLMTIIPGFIGQPIIVHCLDKATKLSKLVKSKYPERNINITLDGGIKENNILDIVKTGANYAVVGTGVFSHASPAEALRNIQNKISLFSNKNVLYHNYD